VAEEKLAMLAALSQVQEGDRPAFVAAARVLIAELRADAQAVSAASAILDRLLENKIAARLLVFGLAVAAKLQWLQKIEQVSYLPEAERATVPACLARVIALAKDLNLVDFKAPGIYVDEAAKQISSQSTSLETAHLQVLAEMGVNGGNPDLTFTASAAGLERGGPSEASFLLLRAKGLPPQQWERRGLCTAAAVQMARQNRDTEVLEQATNLLSGPLRSAGLELQPEEAAEVLRKEKAEPKFLARSGDGPDYSAILRGKRCDCPDCRQKRGEIEPDENPYDDIEDEPKDADLDAIFDEVPIPPDMPKEIAQILFEETRQAVANGESLDSFMKRMFGSTGGRRSSRKGRR
jgi:hypothetical protein